MYRFVEFIFYLTLYIYFLVKDIVKGREKQEKIMDDYLSRLEKAHETSELSDSPDSTQIYQLIRNIHLNSIYEKYH